MAGLGTDAQGGRFHLLFGDGDWRACREVVERPTGPTEVGPVLVSRVDDPTRFEWDASTGSLRLAHRDPVPLRRRAADLHSPEQRRGADRAPNGVWYWIGEDRRSIVHLPPGAPTAEPWWSADAGDGCEPSPPLTRCAAPTSPWPPGPLLAGLAITTRRALVVGLADDEGGLLVFDLDIGGSPSVLRWPGGRVVTPFDLAARRHGGLLVLDRIRRTWWSLDAGFRVLASVSDDAPPPFRSESADTADAAPTTVIPEGNLLPTTGPLAVVDPVAIESSPGDVVLLLDRPSAGPSAVVVVTDRVVTGRIPLVVEAADPADPDAGSFAYDVVGQDLALSAAGDTEPLNGPLVYIGDGATGQVIAATLDAALCTVAFAPDYLPVARWEGRGLVATGGDVFYDGAGRWLSLEPFGKCTFERVAVFRTPTGWSDGSPPAPVIGQPFDSAMPGCAWHRLFLDAEIPEGTGITVAARASDDPDLLERLPFRLQPVPYLRGHGSELPWTDPWHHVTKPVSPRTGTWELLFQHVDGRYLQLEVAVYGTGGSTPSIRALRTWFPRFSYVSAYLPGVYQDSDDPGGLLERLLANPEGWFTDLEGELDHLSSLLDSRTVPVDAVDWLAAWLGLSLEPAWPDDRRRFLIRHADQFYRRRGTVAGLLAILRLYLGCAVDDSVFDPVARQHDPARIVERFRARPRAARGADDPALVASLAHRFRVLVASDLPAEQAAMVERIVEVAKPAHTSYEIRAYRDLFVVGEARVGVDTVVGDSRRFTPMVLGRTPVAAGFVAAVHPFELTDRVVTDRDRIGEVPPL